MSFVSLSHPFNTVTHCQSLYVMLLNSAGKKLVIIGLELNTAVIISCVDFSTFSFNSLIENE